MPREAKIIAVGVQYDYPCMWAIVTPEDPMEDRHFVTRVTGIEFEGENETGVPLKYLGTYQIPGSYGPFVGHVFEVLNKELIEDAKRHNERK
jgi:hypothetical protein